jgi:N-acyl-phosphatidylethanolamine-hydrolysing phospholipase D
MISPLDNRSKPIVEPDGTFRNPFVTFSFPSFGKALRWMICRKGPKFPSEKEAREMFPVSTFQRELVYRCTESAGTAAQGHQTHFRRNITATWIGHATYLVQCNGVTVLTDPMFSDRASPIEFAGPKRFVPPAIPLQDLPFIDVVTVSHNHYDHLDYASVKFLAKQFNPIFVVPTGMKKWFASWFQKEDLDLLRVREVGWWEHCDLFATEQDLFNVFRREVTAGGTADGEVRVRVHGVPAQHYSLRGLFDRYRQLWCGFVCDLFIPNEETRSSAPAYRRFYHSGDTGYCCAFKEIGEEYGPIDIALLPIGAYEPRDFMESQHIGPFEAVEIHHDVRARHSLAMHWGTFLLTDEPLLAPPKLLKSALDAKFGKDSPLGKRFHVVAHGETVLFGDEELTDLPQNAEKSS